MPKNPTEAQIEASRRNGAKSRGPLTDAGKAIARAQLDRTTHGLLAKTVVLPGESADRFSDLHHQLHLDFQPQTCTEALMIEHLAAAAWRIRRAQAYERTLLSSGEASDLASSTTVFQKAPLRKALRYESSAFNQFTKSHRDLLRLQLVRHQLLQPDHRELPLEPEKDEVSD